MSGAGLSAAWIDSGGAVVTCRNSMYATMPMSVARSVVSIFISLVEELFQLIILYHIFLAAASKRVLV